MNHAGETSVWLSLVVSGFGTKQNVQKREGEKISLAEKKKKKLKVKSRARRELQVKNCQQKCCELLRNCPRWCAEQKTRTGEEQEGEGEEDG